MIGAGIIRSVYSAFASLRAAVEEVGKSGTIACWGDSITAGSGGTPYPTQLAALTGAAIVNGGVPGETSTQIRTRMVADAANRKALVIIWAGRNNVGDQAAVLGDIAAMVASLGHDNYLVLTILNGEAADEYAGGAKYAQIAAINAQILSTYGAKALDIRATMVAAFNPAIPQDVIDHGHDIVPSSLRFDALHPNTAGYALIASTIRDKIAAPLSVGKIVTTTLLRYLFASPPCDIGTVAPVAVKATSVNLGPFTLGKSADNNLEVGAAVLPLADYTYNLGSLGRRWAQVWVAQSIRFGNGNSKLTAAGDNASILCEASFLPSADAVKTLGQPAFQWSYAYLSTGILIGGVQVLAARQTGWTAGTGTANKGAFAADTATAVQAAQRVLALEQALRAHGLIN